MSKQPPPLSGALPKRKRLPHEAPHNVPVDAAYFITINCLLRDTNCIAHPAIAEKLIASIVYRARLQQWWPHLVLFMPDHIHAIVSFAPDPGMRICIRSWKKFNTRYHGTVWQEDFFDHRIRDAASFQEKWTYVVQNPVRAGLVQTAEEWPYVWNEAYFSNAIAFGTRGEEG